ncbi:MAG TPA: hypothetical protein VFI42_05440 [Thermomicrobiaceae bacterium]|jgi:hypothetical protein|nr:hypothetical protein [Thermomicrobiaceae bacterium]
MHVVRFSRWGGSATAPTRQTTVSRTAKLACGVALALTLSGVGLIQPAAAQDDDDTITLTGGGATLTVSPGNADAVSAVAEAHASPGHAETIGAAARAVADCEDGAMTQGAAALAVAHPDEGALTQSSAREMVASIQDEVRASLRGDNDDEDASPIRKVVENKCHQEKEEKKAPPAPEVAPPAAPEAPAPVIETLPVTGSGLAAPAALSGLLAAASAAAALGAFGLRRREQLV